MLSYCVDAPLPGMITQQETFGYYGPDGQRWKTVLKRNGSVAKTVIFAGDYERATRGDTVTHLYYIAGGEGLCGIYVKQFKGNTVLKNGMYCIHTDHLGSLAIITDANGNVKQKCTFDAWGSRTFITKDPTLIFDRGYTGHEHLPEFGLINMNGRMYDPIVGRFLSPAPFVQAPDFSQSFNRYSYALNNPLIYIDPTGEFFFTALLGPVGAIIDAACWGAVFGGASYTASVAFSDGGFKNWNWGDFGRSAGIGALSGAVTFGVGQMFGPVGSMGIGGELGRAFTHGVMNGYIAGVTGGDPMSAFAAGGLGSLAGSAFMMYGGKFASSTFGNYAFSGLAGGVGAELTGGNFWQGAGIGLMTAGLNHLQSAVDEFGARYYANRKAAYKDMWDNSFVDGVATREVSAWELENGNTIMLPYDKNTLKASHNDALPVSTMNANGTRHVKYKGTWYTISGHAHTHPTMGPHLGLTRADYEMFLILNGSRVHNKIPLTILYNKSIYSSIFNTRTGLWNSVRKGTW